MNEFDKGHEKNKYSILDKYCVSDWLDTFELWELNYYRVMSHKVACTFGPFFEKIMKRYPIFSLQINNHQIDQRHK